MSEAMRKIGAGFQKKRQELHLSLKEVETSTSIRAGYLKAIEEGNIHELISGVYAVGFMKQYANFLGFDGERLIQENLPALQIRKEKPEFSYGIGTLEIRGSLGGGVKWLPNLLWASGAFALILVVYYFAKAIGLL